MTRPRSDRLNDLVREYLQEKDTARIYLRRAWLLAASRVLREARVQAGLTQEQLGERMGGKKQSQFTRWENDPDGRISLHNFIDALLACGVMPLDIEGVPFEDMREYALNDPRAPRTGEAFGGWRSARMELKEWLRQARKEQVDYQIKPENMWNYVSHAKSSEIQDRETTRRTSSVADQADWQQRMAGSLSKQNLQLEAPELMGDPFEGLAA